MYGKLKQSLSDDRIELLRRYFEAMNNFYQTIPLKRMFKIINSQNEEQYSEEDFLAFAEIARHEHHFYGILGKDELYDDVPAVKPFERELVHESLSYFDIYYKMADIKCDKPYYVPPKDELLKYEDEFYVDKTPQYKAMASFVNKYIERTFADVDEVMDEILFIVKSEDSSPDEALDFFASCGGRGSLSERQYKEFVRLYITLHNNTRNPYNNGFTPSELLKRTGDCVKSLYLREPTFMNVLSYDISEDTEAPPQPVKSKKIGRNEPCPCGSGKKYKKCCGR